MKYTEFHRRIKANGWKFSHAEGSHYFYTKGSKLSPPVPFHGAKEIPRTATAEHSADNGHLIGTKGKGARPLFPLYNKQRIYI